MENDRNAMDDRALVRGGSHRLGSYSNAGVSALDLAKGGADARAGVGRAGSTAVSLAPSAFVPVAIRALSAAPRPGPGQPSRIRGPDVHTALKPVSGLAEDQDAVLDLEIRQTGEIAGKEFGGLRRSG